MIAWILAAALWGGGPDTVPSLQDLHDGFLGLPGLGPRQEAAPAPPPASAPPETRVPVKVEDFKAIVESNPFAPYKKKETVKPPEPSPREVKKDPPKPRMLTFTGFVWIEKEKRFEAVVEDREYKEKDRKYAVKEVRFCKAGDAVGAGTILEVGPDSARMKLADGEKVLRSGDQIAAPAEAAPEKEGEKAPAEAKEPEKKEPEKKEPEKKEPEKKEREKKDR